MTITTKSPKSKKYNVTVDLVALERIAGSLGLFQRNFVLDLNQSLRDMKANKFVRAKTLADFK